MINLEQLKKQALSAVKSAKDAKTLEDLRVRFLGREKGELTKILRSLGTLPLEDKRKLGPQANALRQELETAFNKKLEELKVNSQKSGVGVDITMPGKKVSVGHLHILTQVEKQVRDIFKSLNFSVVEGPEVETEYYNFDALNIPKNHPARDMWDTFWILQNRIKNEKMLLRTHTSPVQVRYMENHQPPFQIIVPGRVFRFEATDASHEINFHQVEGLMIGEDVNLANFKYVIEQFFHRLFSPHVQIRFRPSYFPFVEPGLEVDIKLTDNKQQTTNDSHKPLAAGNKSEWLEVMGAGMVHPKVLGGVGYNPKYVQGF